MWECSSLQEVNFIDAKKFINKKINLIIKPEYKYFALVKNKKILSILGVSEGNVLKIHCNYTPVELRGNGYFTELLKLICNLYSNKIIIADCLKTSKDIYLKNGFNLVKHIQYKMFDIYKVERR